MMRARSLWSLLLVSYSVAGGEEAEDKARSSVAGGCRRFDASEAQGDLSLVSIGDNGDVDILRRDQGILRTYRPDISRPVERELKSLRAQDGQMIPAGRVIGRTYFVAVPGPGALGGTEHRLGIVDLASGALATTLIPYEPDTHYISAASNDGHSVVIQSRVRTNLFKYTEAELKMRQYVVYNVRAAGWPLVVPLRSLDNTHDWYSRMPPICISDDQRIIAARMNVDTVMFVDRMDGQLLGVKDPPSHLRIMGFSEDPHVLFGYDTSMCAVRAWDWTTNAVVSCTGRLLARRAKYIAAAVRNGTWILALEHECRKGDARTCTCVHSTFNDVPHVSLGHDEHISPFPPGRRGKSTRRLLPCTTFDLVGGAQHIVLSEDGSHAALMTWVGRRPHRLISLRYSNDDFELHAEEQKQHGCSSDEYELHQQARRSAIASKYLKTYAAAALRSRRRPTRPNRTAHRSWWDLCAVL